eukprot:TRINITY_DN43788_c0_g1_i1.p1 TRINITY_DN43788_c0_g1~~TRINITY_DN43788_c0_g1_i1.p1  ORF type:complete len:480 (+),score=92.77 TRINITY_DN43788_c0_g1_i1:23-1441(+)
MTRAFPLFVVVLACALLLLYNVQRTVEIGFGRSANAAALSMVETTKQGAVRQIKQLRVAELPSDPEGNPLDVTKETHLNWQVQIENPNAAERRLRCDNTQADIFNTLGADAVQAVVNGDWRSEGNLTEAAALFRRAAGFAPGCPVPHINLAIVLFALEDYQGAEQALDAAVRNETALLQNGALRAKAVLFRAIVYEASKRYHENPDALYKTAIQQLPIIALEYFGVLPNVAQTQNLRLINDARTGGGASIVAAAMRRLLLVKEFAKWFGGHPAIQRHEAQQWPKNWYFFVRRMLPPYALQVAQDCYRKLILGKHLHFKDPQATRYISYNDLVGRFLQAQYRELVERIVDAPVKPTYTYFGGYVGSAVLAPHTDRQQCEFTVTLNLDVNPADAYCPVGLGKKARPGVTADFRGDPNERMPPQAEQVYVYPRPGDALLFKGRHLVHWRHQIPSWQNCTNIFLHYVPSGFTGSLN